MRQWKNSPPHAPSWRHVEARGRNRFAGSAKHAKVGRGILRGWLATQRGCVWRPIFVLGRFFLLDRLFRRNNPLERAALAHSSLEEVRSARQERQNRPHEIGRIF